MAWTDIPYGVLSNDEDGEEKISDNSWDKPLSRGTTLPCQFIMFLKLISKP
jgi:hypothetical protein